MAVLLLSCSWGRRCSQQVSELGRAWGKHSGNPKAVKKQARAVPPEPCLCSQQAGFAPLHTQPQVSTVQNTLMLSAFPASTTTSSAIVWDVDQAPDTHQQILQVIFFPTAGYEGFQSTLFRDEVQGPSASAAPSPPSSRSLSQRGFFPPLMFR